jgi:hypothetical protein
MEQYGDLGNYMSPHKDGGGGVYTALIAGVYLKRKKRIEPGKITLRKKVWNRERRRNKFRTGWIVFIKKKQTILQLTWVFTTHVKQAYFRKIM